MRRLVGVIGALVLLTAAAAADDRDICRNGVAETKIAACTRLIESGRLRGPGLANVFISRSAEQYRQNQYDRALTDVNSALRADPNNARAFYGRGLLHAAKKMPDQALADYSAAVRFDPTHRAAFMHRAQIYAERNEHDRAIADFGQAIRIDPSLANAYIERGRVYARKGDHDRALADYTTAIRVNPNVPYAFNQRGLVYAERKEFDRALADYNEALRLSPRMASALNNRGVALSNKGDLDRALADLDDAVRLAPNVAIPYRQRAAVLEKKGTLDKALADYRQALALDPQNGQARDGVTRTEAALRSVGAPVPAAAPVTQQATAVSAPPAATFEQAPSADTGKGASTQAGNRVALVIGNGAYQHSGKLTNPTNDAADIAGALRKLGFDVVEGRDLDKRGLEDKVREFGRKLDRASLALFFYAGHGIQVGGKNYLIPTDAKLERAGDLTLDTVDVSQVLAQMEAEQQRVNLVFLDACRDNPLARSFSRSLGTRSTSVGSGLASIQSAIGTMIVYATQPDNVALDGTGRNSPFTSALLKHLATPGLDIGAVMRRVRTDVVAATKGKQVPWDHSSLMGDVVLAR